MPENLIQEQGEMLSQAIAASKQLDVAQREMPRYRCHKEVWALKIKDITDPTEPGNESDGSRVLHFADGDYAPLRVPHDYVHKHKPQAGGYYVVYVDGYKSWSPAEAFESGYSRI